MNDLELMNHAHKMVAEFNHSLLDRTLENSKGEPEMSAKDTKLVILTLIGIVKNQENMIQKLIREENITKEERQSVIDKFLKNRKTS